MSEDRWATSRRRREMSRPRSAAAHVAVQFAAVAVFPYLVPVVPSRITKHVPDADIRAAENCVAVAATLIDPVPLPLAHAGATGFVAIDA